MNADYLTDGGVFDNLGCSAVSHFGSHQPSVTHMLVSDASAGFDWKLDWSFRGIVSRTARTTDILMQRLASLEEHDYCGSDLEKVVIPISETVRASDLKAANGYAPQDLELQILASQIRTDLDEFSWEEIAALIRHGYEVALKRVTADASLCDSVKTSQPSDPCVVPELPGGWDWAPEHIEKVSVLRGLFRLGDIFRTVSEKEYDSRRGIAALFGGSIPPPEESESSSDYARRLTAAKKSLQRSQLRRLGLWNWNDWVCWLDLLALFTLLAIAFWWYRIAHT
jgi:hypothetical protein